MHAQASHNVQMPSGDAQTTIQKLLMKVRNRPTVAKSLNLGTASERNPST